MSREPAHRATGEDSFPSVRKRTHWPQHWPQSERVSQSYRAVGVPALLSPVLSQRLVPAGGGGCAPHDRSCRCWAAASARQVSAGTHL